MDGVKRENKVLELKRDQTIRVNECIVSGAHDAVFASISSRDIDRVFKQTGAGKNTDVVIV